LHKINRENKFKQRPLKKEESKIGDKKIIIILVGVIFCVSAYAQECVECHKEVTPQIVGDWQLSKHSQNEINCSVCHGDAHKDPYDVANAQIPTPDTCANCHDERAEQFKAGKHAAA
jgi:hydroxylamine dehydrogenase